MTERLLKRVSDECADGATDISDDELMLRSAAGCAEAFESLVRRYYGMVWASASQYLGERSLGKDVAQDTFLSIWNHRSRYVPKGRFKRYMIKVMFNICHMTARANKAELKRKQLLHQEREIEQVSTDVPLDILMQGEMCHLVQAKLVQLPDKERKVLLLRYGQDMTMVETAELLGIPLGTAKSHASRGLKRLYDSLKRKSVDSLWLNDLYV